MHMQWTRGVAARTVVRVLDVVDVAVEVAAARRCLEQVFRDLRGRHPCSQVRNSRCSAGAFQLLEIKFSLPFEL